MLEQKTISELVRLHNELAAGTKTAPLTSWKRAKPMLIDRIRSLAGNLYDLESATGLTETLAQSPTIKQAALKLLCAVDFYENRETGERDNGPNYTNARSVGFSYPEIVRRIRKAFPGAKTSVECLRWYCVHIRANSYGYEGYTLPARRPQERQAR